LAPRLNRLGKHEGRKKVIIAILGICKTWEFYMKDSIHVKIEHLYVIAMMDTIAN
jgi:hypothetical protein